MTEFTAKIAAAFVEARKSKRSLSNYPGQVPEHLKTAYEIQDAAIDLWKEDIIGWKIGRLSPDKQGVHGTERLTGPIFKSVYAHADGSIHKVKVFGGGFAAVEAEYVFEVGCDCPADKADYSEADALSIIKAVYGGVEMAGSPLATINALGPTVVASDFGNNNGLILGPCLRRFSDSDTVACLDAEHRQLYKASTSIDGVEVGVGGLFSMPNGPLKAIAWLAGHLAMRGRPLQKGQYISSGASTGIHDIGPDQAAQVRFVGPEEGGFTIRLATVLAA
jgi:2-keto-4-pentenoate hydratase